MRKSLPSTIIILLAISAIAIFTLNYLAEKGEETEDCYVGVSFGGKTSAEAELLIDGVKSYTNLFVLQSGPISENESATNEICDYAVAAGLDIIVFFGDLDPKIVSEKDLR